MQGVNGRAWAILSFGVVAPFLAAMSTALLRRNDGAVVPATMGLLLGIMGLAFGAIVLVVGFKPALRGDLPLLLRPVVAVNYVLVAATPTAIAFIVARFIVEAVWSIYLYFTQFPIRVNLLTRVETPIVLGTHTPLASSRCSGIQ